jgi:uncharacterized Zn-finger protein
MNESLDYDETSKLEDEKANINKTMKVYSCPYDFCNKAFRERGNLRTHLRVHVSIYFFYSKTSDW